MEIATELFLVSSTLQVPACTLLPPSERLRLTDELDEDDDDEVDEEDVSDTEIEHKESSSDEDGTDNP